MKIFTLLLQRERTNMYSRAIDRFKMLSISFIFTSVLVYSAFLPAIAFANHAQGRTITSASLNPSTVASGGSSQATVNVTTNEQGHGNNYDNWRSTSWRVGDSGTFTCVDTSNFTSPDNHSDSFSITAPVTPGTYNVHFIAYSGSNSCTDEASAQFTLSQGLIVNPVVIVDSTAPIVTVNLLNTDDTTPALSGTVDDDTATIEVTVSGNTYPASNNADGTWSLADNTISPPLTDGAYNVAVTATDVAGNQGQDTTADELTIDTSSKSITDVTLDGENQVIVTPGSTIATKVTVAVASGNGKNWKSTSWSIGDTSSTCVNHDDHTAANASYEEEFGIVAPLELGTYDATFTAFSDDACSTGASEAYVIDDGVIVTLGMSSISGLKFNDHDSDGVYEVEEEPVLSDWTIELYKGESTEVFATAMTGADGSYVFDDLEMGTYFVCEVQKTSWTQTYPNQNNEDSVEMNDGHCWTVTIDGLTQEVTDKNFGNAFDTTDTGGEGSGNQGGGASSNGGSTVVLASTTGSGNTQRQGTVGNFFGAQEQFIPTQQTSNNPEVQANQDEPQTSSTNDENNTGEDKTDDNSYWENNWWWIIFLLLLLAVLYWWFMRRRTEEEE